MEAADIFQEQIVRVAVVGAVADLVMVAWEVMLLVLAVMEEEVTSTAVVVEVVLEDLMGQVVRAEMEPMG